MRGEWIGLRGGWIRGGVRSAGHGLAVKFQKSNSQYKGSNACLSTCCKSSGHESKYTTYACSLQHLCQPWEIIDAGIKDGDAGGEESI